MRNLIRFAAVSFGAFVASTASAQRPTQPNANVPALNRAIDRANFDTTCSACSDFYTFANGGWLKRNTIPAAYGSWGSFNELQDKNETVVHDVIEAALKSVRAGSVPPTSNVYKVGAFYEACVDTIAIEALGTKPIDA